MSVLIKVAVPLSSVKNVVNRNRAPALGVTSTAVVSPEKVLASPTARWRSPLHSEQPADCDQKSLRSATIAPLASRTDASLRSTRKPMVPPLRNVTLHTIWPPAARRSIGLGVMVTTNCARLIVKPAPVGDDDEQAARVNTRHSSGWNLIQSSLSWSPYAILRAPNAFVLPDWRGILYRQCQIGSRAANLNNWSGRRQTA